MTTEDRLTYTVARVAYETIKPAQWLRIRQHSVAVDLIQSGVPRSEVVATFLEHEPHAVPDITPLRVFQAAVDQVTDRQHRLAGEKTPMSGFVAEPPVHAVRMGVGNTFQKLIQRAVSSP